MPVPVGFQLGLELTNIVNPISQVVSSLGSLALVDAIRKAGSDSITETKLASLLGRHRIDDVINFHFREIVAKADQSTLSRYMDIVLESGAGPTVQQALKNPALFSMVIQLSGLAFAHEHQSLALMLVEAVDRIVRDSGGDAGVVPDYVALLGTIRACQEQTAAFQWAALYEAVEHKVQSTLKSNVPNRATDTTRDGEENLFVLVMPETVSIRRIPFAIFQSLLMWLQSLQSFPEHRLLHLRCDTGINTIVVWCYCILGISVTVLLGKSEIRFGDGSSVVIIEESEKGCADASLMDPIDLHQPLFSLVEDYSSPEIAHEHRTKAFGYGLKTLQQARLPDQKISYCSHWVIARCIAISQALSLPRQNEVVQINSIIFDKHFKTQSLLDEQIVRAGKFLFALEGDEWQGITSKSPGVPSKICWPNLVSLIFTFARIEEDDLEDCRNMPLCLGSFRDSYDIDDPGHETEWVIPTLGFEEFNLMSSFSILTRLLLGKAYSEDYIKPAVLISGWGWSIFFDSVDADDPLDTSINAMRVVRGVPSRHGLRKARIIDGPTDIVWSIEEEDRMPGCNGLSTAKRDRILVGQTSDAFQITQLFNWNQGTPLEKSSSVRPAKIGFRAMQEVCVRTKRVPACNCEVPYQTFQSHFDGLSSLDKVHIDGNVHGGRDPGWLLERNEGARKILCQVRWPKHQITHSPPSSRERVLRSRVLNSDLDVENLLQIHKYTWLWDVSDNPAARWLLALHLSARDDDERFCLVIKGRDTCWRCVYDKALECAGDPAVIGKDMCIRVIL